MTDQTPDRDDAALKADLDAWFQGEVRQAAADLRRAPLRPARARVAPVRAVAGPAVAATLVVILVVAGISRLPAFSGPLAEPTGRSSVIPTLGPTRTPASPSPGPVAGIEERYADGIPMQIDGSRVLRVTDAPTRAPVDDGSFLLGGWMPELSTVFYACPLILQTPPPFGPVCGNPFVAETPLVFGDGPRVQLEDWPSTLSAGPTVLRVHRHDPRSEDCSPELRDTCELMGVVEEVVWAGDWVTSAAPLTAVDALNRLAGAEDGFYQATLVPVPGRPSALDPAGRPGASGDPRRCEPPFPTLSWSVAGSSITWVLVFPTTASREAVDQNLNASGYRGTTPAGEDCIVMTDAAFSYEWIAVHNVMVAVEVNVDGPTAAQAKVIDAARGILDLPVDPCPAGGSCPVIPKVDPSPSSG